MNIFKKIFNRANKRNETESIDTFSCNEFVEPAYSAILPARNPHDTSLSAGDPMTMTQHAILPARDPHDTSLSAGDPMTMTQHAILPAGDPHDTSLSAGDSMTMMSHGEPKTPHPHDIGAFMDSEFRRIRRWK